MQTCSENGESPDALLIVLQGESVVEGFPLEGEVRGKGTCWGLNDLASRLSKTTVRAETQVHVLSLSRLDFIAGERCCRIRYEHWLIFEKVYLRRPRRVPKNFILILDPPLLQSLLDVA
jgi:hypothetical protein